MDAGTNEDTVGQGPGQTDAGSPPGGKVRRTKWVLIAVAAILTLVLVLSVAAFLVARSGPSLASAAEECGEEVDSLMDGYEVVTLGATTDTSDYVQIQCMLEELEAPDHITAFVFEEDPNVAYDSRDWGDFSVTRNKLDLAFVVLFSNRSDESE